MSWSQTAVIVFAFRCVCECGYHLSAILTPIFSPLPVSTCVFSCTWYLSTFRRHLLSNCGNRLLKYSALGYANTEKSWEVDVRVQTFEEFKAAACWRVYFLIFVFDFSNFLDIKMKYKENFQKHEGDWFHIKCWCFSSLLNHISNDHFEILFWDKLHTIWSPGKGKGKITKIL